MAPPKMEDWGFLIILEIGRPWIKMDRGAIMEIFFIKH
jgi:hypothetical protein